MGVTWIRGKCFVFFASALAVLSGCANPIETPYYGNNFSPGSQRSEVDPLSIDEKELLEKVQLLNESGVEGPPRDPRNPNVWPYGALMVPKKGKGTHFTCTTSHVALGLVKFSGHCLQNRKGTGRPYPEDHFVVFYNRAGKITCVRLESILYFSDENAKDLAIAKIPDAAARDWHVVAQNFSESLGGPSEPVTRALVMSYDPVSLRPDIKLKDSEKDAAIFAPKRCAYFEQAPRFRNATTGANVKVEAKAEIQAYAYLDGCTNLTDGEAKSSMPGNSGSLIIEEKTGKLLASLESILIKKELKGNEYQSHFVGRDGMPLWIPVSRFPGDGDFSIVSFAIRLQAVATDLVFQRDPNYQRIFGILPDQMAANFKVN